MPVWVQAYQLALVMAGAVSATLLLFVWRHREKLGAVPLLVTFVGALIWIGCDLAVTVTRGSPLAISFLRAVGIGSTLVSLGYVLLAFEYTGREEWVTKQTAAILLVVPIVVVGLTWTNDVHGLVWTIAGTDSTTLTGYAVEPGLVWFLSTAYLYVLNVVATILLVSFAVRAPHVYRTQTVAIVVGALVPWIGNGVTIAGFVPADLTPIAFTITGTTLGWAILRAQFLDLVPIGRDVVINELHAAVFIVDRQDRLVDVNQTGKRLLGFGLSDDLIGRHVRDLLDGRDAFHERYLRPDGGGLEADFDFEMDGHTYHVEHSPLHGRGDSVVGRAILVRDITERKEREQQLRQQKDQLERFASIVSHDLRNPLSVIEGRTALIEEETDEVTDHVRSIEENAARMENIIQDVLAMTRRDPDLSLVSVELASVASDAWDHVETGNATLEIQTDATVMADADRLVQVFENLFRNSVEHGGQSVTVRVGDLDDATGFFVADDGSGISAGDRDAILEDGYTTSSDGTGLGMTIVTEIVDAHDWEIRVTDSAAEGARFDIQTEPTPD